MTNLPDLCRQAIRDLDEFWATETTETDRALKVVDTLEMIVKHVAGNDPVVRRYYQDFCDRQIDTIREETP